MMCQSHVSKFYPFVQGLIKLDPNLYSNYDEAVKFVLSTTLSLEEKMMAIHHLAFIYDELHKQSSKITVGESEKVKASWHLMDRKKPSVYLDVINKIYDLSDKAPTEKSIEKALDRLSAEKVLTPSTLTQPGGAIHQFKTFVNSKVFATPEERQKFIEEFRDKLVNAITNGTDDAYLNSLAELAKDELNDLIYKSSFVPLSAIESLAGINNLLVNMMDGTLQEGEMREDGVYVNGKGPLKQGVDMRGYVEARNDARINKDNDVEQIFSPESLLSGFMLSPLVATQAERDAFFENIKKMDAPESRIRIFAVRNTVGDERVRRIHQAAEGTEGLEALKNREHETFENKAKVDKLRSAHDQVVMAVARQKAAENDFMLYGQMPDGTLFAIYGMNNFAFVRSNNTTELVDFTNPDHQNLVKKLSLINDFGNRRQLSNAELEVMSNLHNEYKLFQAAVAQGVADEFAATGKPVDITEQFYSFYTAGPASRRTMMTMEERVATDPNMSLPVTVVKKRGEEIISREERRMPIMFAREKSSDDAYFRRVSLLGPDEYILLPDGRTVDHREYVEEVLGINHRFIVDNLLKKKDEQMFQSNIAIRFSKGLPVGYLATNAMRPMSQAEDFSRFIIALDNILDIENIFERSEAIKKLMTQQYNFYFRNGCFLDFSIDIRPVIPEGESRLQIELRAAEERSPLSMLGQAPSNIKNLFNFKLDEKVIRDMANNLRGTHGDIDSLVNKVIKENPSLEPYATKSKDGNFVLDAKEDGAYAFYQAVNDLKSSNMLGPLGKKLLANIEKASDKFAKTLVTSVVSKLEARAEKAVELQNAMGAEPTMKGFMPAFRKMMTFQKMGYRPDLLFAEEDASGRIYPQIIYNRKSDEQLSIRANYYRKLRNYNQVSTVSREFAFVSRNGSATKPKTAPAPVAKAPVAAPVVQVTTPAPAAVEKTNPTADDYIEIDPFATADQLGKELVQASDAQILSEVALVKSILPQFDINLEDLDDIMRLANMNGFVLGMYKDKVLYLSKAMRVGGVLYHEAFHGVFRNLMTEEKRRELLDAVQGNRRYASSFTEAAMREFADRRKLQYDPAVIKDLVAEEILAEGFRNHVVSKTKATGIFAKLFELLKKLFRMFSSYNRLVDNTYQSILDGQYSKVTLKSGIMDGHAAYEMIYGRNAIVNVGNSSKFTAKSKPINETHRKQIVNLMVEKMLADGRTIEFDQKFKEQAMNLMKEFDLESQIARLKADGKITDDEAGAIRKEHGEMFDNFRFILGARMNGIDVPDINYTGSAELDNKQFPNRIPGVAGQIIRNDDGSHSFNQLKDAVMKRLQELTIKSENEKDVAVDNVNQETNKKDKAENPDADLDDEYQADDFSASTVMETNRLDSIPTQARAFIAQIRRDITTDKGIVIPNMLDADTIFPYLMSVMANHDSHDIVNRIKREGDRQIEDGNVEFGKDLLSLYDKVSKLTNADYGGDPINNSQLYYMLIDAFNGTELDFVVIRHAMPALVSKEADLSDAELLKASGKQEVTFSIRDKVATGDMISKRRTFIQDVILTQNKIGKTEEYKRYLDELLEVLDGVKTSDALLSSTDPDRLERLTDKLHKALENIGMKFPKSLIRLSLYGIEVNENKKAVKLSEKQQEFINDNQDFLIRKEYLEKQFFKSLDDIVRRVKGGPARPAQKFESLLDAENTRDAVVKTFNSVFRRAAKFMIKYDPLHLPAMIRNAEGKPIYRYIKNFPMMTTIQDLRRKGLEGLLKQDPNYEMFSKFFLKDNMALGKVLDGTDNSKEAREVRLFLERFNVALFGGAEQTFGDVMREGKSFTNIDRGSLLALYTMAFMDREVETSYEKDENGNPVSTTIQTFLRNFGQIESTNTNFMVSGMYMKFAGQKGIELTKDGFVKMTDILESKVRQEFNRISREWSQRLTNKRDADNRELNSIKDEYNGRLNDDRITADTESSDLRAYNFHALADFFAANEELKEDLINLAKGSQENGTGTQYDELPEDARATIRQALNAYALDQFEKNLQDLERENVIQRKSVPMLQTEIKDVIDYENPTQIKKLRVLKQTMDPMTLDPVFYPVLDAKGNPRVTVEVITSTVLPSKIKIGFDKPVSIESQYGTVENSEFTEMGKSVANGELQATANIKGLLADAFFNHWANTLLFNDVFQGDPALNVSSAQDLLKRQKKEAAAGSTLMPGYHRLAVMDTIQGFIHEDPKYINHGPYFRLQDIYNDPNLTAEQVVELADAFTKAKNGVVEEVNGKTVKYSKMMRDIFDGQSVSLLMHQMDMFQSIGRLNADVKRLLIAKHYRRLTASEVATLGSMRVVNNPKKTVTASTNEYIKQSENPTDRLDVSSFKTEVLDKYSKEELEDKLHEMWSQVYDLRMEHKRRLAAQTDVLDENADDLLEIEAQIKNIVSEIHDMYEAVPGREFLHELLNTMEYNQIDQVVDTTASKNSKMLPTNITNVESAPRDTNGYLDLKFSSQLVNNKYKYLQVETSGVSNKAKISVQRKMLLPADLNNLADIIDARLRKNNQEPLTPKEMAEIKSVMSKLVSNYQSSMKQSAQARLLYLTNVMRQDGDFKVGEMFDLIRENLALQGAPTEMLEMFSTNAEGNPVYSPNLPEIRNALKYYFFAQYSKMVTDEKGSGGKFIHISSMGYNVMVDENNRVITREEYERNRDLYPEKPHTRPLGVEISYEYDKDGNKIKVYHVECLVPRPFFESEEHRQFFENQLRRMYATRIPTEDMRSMIALKAVDYIDGSNLNGIVVPHFVHLLAGSDFDVDALYTQMTSYYRDLNGKYHAYGDYSGYGDIKTGEFLEYLHYMSKRSEFKDLITARRDELIMSDEPFKPSEALNDVMQMMGIAPLSNTETLDLTEMKNRLKDLRTQIQNIEDMREMYRHDITQFEEDVLYGTVELKNKKGKPLTLDQLQNIKQQKIERIRKATEERRALVLDAMKTREEMANIRRTLAMVKVQAILDTMEKMKLPTSKSGFESASMWGEMVADKYQNENFEATMAIMTNPLVYENLYINERSSADGIEEAMTAFGLSLKSLESNMNHYTLNAMVKAKADFSMMKSGVGIAANANKLLAFASWNQFKLNRSIWSFRTSPDGEIVEHKKLGGLNEDGERTIAVVGNIIGVMADGVKKPYPSVLMMNEVNMGVALNLASIGFNLKFALGFNFLPEVRNAVERVNASKKALTQTLDDSYVFFNNAIQEELINLFKQKDGEDNTVFETLREVGLIDPRSSMYKPRLNSENLVVSFEAQKLDADKMNENRLTAGNIGYQVGTVDNRMLSDKVQKAVMLIMYHEQAKQAWQFLAATSVINLHKRLNPDFAVFDKMRKNIEKLLSEGEDALFTKDSIERMMNDQVWSVLFDMVNDMKEQASKLFLERTPFFEPIKNAFDEIFEEKGTIADIAVAYAGIRKFVETFPGSRKSENPVQQAIYDAEDQALKDTFTAEFWYTHNLFGELQALRERMPDNEFLRILTQVNGPEETAAVVDGERRPQRYIRTIASYNPVGDAHQTYANAAMQLMSDDQGKLFLKKLYFHELARTGLGFKGGSFMNLIPAALKLNVSNNIQDFVEILKKNNEVNGTAGNYERMMASFKEFIGADQTAPDTEVFNYFNELMRQMITAAADEPGNTRLRVVRKVSYNASKNATSNVVRALDPVATEGMAAKDKQEIARNIVAKVFGVDPAKMTGTSLTANLLGESFTIDLSISKTEELANERMLTAIGSAYGVKYKGEETFEFPIAVKTQKGVYMLQAVDDAIENSESVGETIVKSLTRDDKYDNRIKRVGNRARYVLMPTMYSKGVINPVGFSKEQSDKFRTYTDRSKVTKIETNPVKQAEQKQAEVKATAPLTGGMAQETQEQANAQFTDAGEIGKEGAMMKEMMRKKMEEAVKLNNLLNMSKSSMEELYKMRDRKMSFDEFTKEAQNIIVTLRDNLPQEQILDRLNCLG